MNKPEQQIIHGYMAGFRAANALKVGDEFQGAANESLFDRDSLKYKGFLIGWLSVIEQRFPSGILCDDSGRILEAGPEVTE